MAKTLPDGRIQVESGDTLSGIYGSNWKALSGYTGDPKRLPIGTILPAKSATSLGGSLTGGTEEKALPSTSSLDQLGMFKDLLKTVTARAAQEAKASGAAALPEGMLKPEQVSGNTFAGILGLVSQEKTRGISDIYESTLNMINESKARADKQLAMLVNTGAIAELDDASLEKLSKMTDYPLEHLQSVKKAAIKEASTVTKLTDADRIIQLNNYLISQVGEDGKTSAKSYIEAYKKWIGLGGAINDFKYAYPVEEWLGEWEYKNLPAGWRPKAESTVPDVSSFTPDQQVLINQIQARIDSYSLTYDEAVEKYPKIAVYLKPAR